MYRHTQRARPRDLRPAVPRAQSLYEADPGTSLHLRTGDLQTSAVALFGDSHLRGLMFKLNQTNGRLYVDSFSGATFGVVLDGIQQTLQTTGRKKVLVVHAGTNDMKGVIGQFRGRRDAETLVRNEAIVRASLIAPYLPEFLSRSQAVLVVGVLPMYVPQHEDTQPLADAFYVSFNDKLKEYVREHGGKVFYKDLSHFENPSYFEQKYDARLRRRVTGEHLYQDPNPDNKRAPRWQYQDLIRKKIESIMRILSRSR